MTPKGTAQRARAGSNFYPKLVAPENRMSTVPLRGGSEWTTVWHQSYLLGRPESSRFIRVCISSDICYSFANHVQGNSEMVKKAYETCILIVMEHHN